MVISNLHLIYLKNNWEKSIQACKEWWFVIMLLRLNYFWWKIRQNFWKKNMPYRVYIHNKKFVSWKTGKQTIIEYIHCVWKNDIILKKQNYLYYIVLVYTLKHKILVLTVLLKKNDIRQDIYSKPSLRLKLSYSYGTYVKTYLDFWKLYKGWDVLCDYCWWIAKWYPLISYLDPNEERIP